MLFYKVNVHQGKIGGHLKQGNSVTEKCEHRHFFFVVIGCYTAAMHNPFS